MKILVTANSSFNLVNFRAGLIRSLKQHGHEIVALVPIDDYTKIIRQELGCQAIELRMDRRGKSLPREAISLYDMMTAIRTYRPDIIISFTIKNNLYGGLVSRVLGVPFIPNITGMGTLFSEDSRLRSIARIAYRFVFKNVKTVFFQNLEDLDQFVTARMIAPSQARLLPGSGVDLNRFNVTPIPYRPNAPVFLLIGRMLWEKGVGEFVEAARKVRKRFPSAVFRIAGGIEPASEAAIPISIVESWEKEGLIEYLGQVRDIKSAIAESSCVVLPTYYREGTPRALLEAAACGRPLITTDTSGCRTVVIDGKSGFLVCPREDQDLADAMVKISEADHSTLSYFGEQGRRHIAENFDERIVIEEYLKAIKEIAGTV